MYKLLPQHHLTFFFIMITTYKYTMNPTYYWPFVRECSIWNTAVAALQFWTADLEPHVLSSAVEHVYTTFFYTNSMYMLCNLPEEVIFGCFVSTLNATFERKLTLENEGYNSGSKHFNMPPPLR